MQPPVPIDVCSWFSVLKIIIEVMSKEGMLYMFSSGFKLCCILVTATSLSACVVSNNPNLVGKRSNYGYSNDISGLREARRGVEIFKSIPPNATNIKKIETQRCHQNFTEEPPTEETLLDDLIVKTYARGADGITDIAHKKESGLLKNCWHVRSATGTTFRLP